ncbi:hypothetical protein D7X87_06485 [bacterium D16-54]|nr:hypothetical protein D7X87_06485 [bacterium D16-54]RKJ15715.1 hypothetical protein D7X65_06480 [bacterium D16-56]
MGICSTGRDDFPSYTYNLCTSDTDIKRFIHRNLSNAVLVIHPVRNRMDHCYDVWKFLILNKQKVLD